MHGGRAELESSRGADIYRVKFEKASQDWRVWLTDDGKVESIGYQLVTPR